MGRGEVDRRVRALVYRRKESVGGEKALVYVSKCVRVLARVALVRERERERM